MRRYLYPLLLCFVLFAFDCKAAETLEQRSAATTNDHEYAAQQYALGNQSLTGGAYTKSDEAAAILHFKEAAKHGHLNAMFALGRMYMAGKGVTKDTEQGIAWLEKAAGSDGLQNAAAAEMLAEHYGLDSLPDTDRCIKGKYWYERAARGSEVAAARLALAYANGQCVERDFAKAAELFLPLAKKGDLLAQITLADYYFKGTGVAQDNREAFFWARCSTRFGGKPSFTFVDVIDPILELKFDLAELGKINERLIKNRCIQPIDAVITPERPLIFKPE